MDINTNTNALQHQPVDATPVRIGHAKQPADSSESAGVLVDAATKKPEHSERDLQKAVTQLNDFAQTIQRNLHFSVDKESGILVTKVIDSKSNEVIRQIPNEETVALAHSLAALGHEAEFNIFSSRA
ncbi:MAG: flagellar protein FlaG [Methylobacter sp.]|nr:flagellar protein FlaG [Methylobacter sp.]